VAWLLPSPLKIPLPSPPIGQPLREAALIVMAWALSDGKNQEKGTKQLNKGKN